MAGERNSPGLWLVALAVAFLAITGVLWPFFDDEPSVQRSANTDTYVDSIQVTSWNWKDDRTGTIFAVYGTIKNLGSQDIQQVVMELRAEDADGQSVGRYPIIARNLPAGAEKPFREDVPRTGREATGYLDVKSLVR